MEQQENTIPEEFAAKCTIKRTPKTKGAYVIGSRDKTNTIAFNLAFGVGCLRVSYFKLAVSEKWRRKLEFLKPWP